MNISQVTVPRMSHTKRLELAKALCARMTVQYPDQVMVGGVFGSTARGVDTPWSDLEMWFIVRDDCPAHGQAFIYRDMAVNYRVFQQSDLERLLVNPSPEWPFVMGVLSVLKVLCGDLNQVKAWLAMGRAAPVEAFRTALQDLLPKLILESYGRIHSCYLRGDNRDLLPSVWEVLAEMLLALSLLNRQWVTHDYFKGLLDSFKFEQLPEGYCELVPLLYDARDIKEILPLADKLVANFWKLLEEAGIQVMKYQKVEELNL